jgi:hypothetical protein
MSDAPPKEDAKVDAKVDTPEKADVKADALEKAEPEKAPEKATDSRSDWSLARPEIIPQPSFWPAGLAFGLTFLFWGFVTSMVLVLVGLAVVVVSIIGWIGEIRHEQRRA